MKIKAFYKYGILLAFILCGGAHADVPSIKVCSPDFSETHTITDQASLKTITAAWLAAEIINEKELPALSKELYKIDFSNVLPSHNGRWLYDKNGYFRFLSKSMTKVFKVNNPEKLNELLEI